MTTNVETQTLSRNLCSIVGHQCRNLPSNVAIEISSLPSNIQLAIQSETGNASGANIHASNMFVVTVHAMKSPINGDIIGNNNSNERLAHIYYKRNDKLLKEEAKVQELRERKAQLELKLKNMNRNNSNTNGNTGQNSKNLIDLLHKYNHIKDLAQELFGVLAIMRQITVTELYSEFGLDLDD